MRFCELTQREGEYFFKLKLLFSYYSHTYYHMYSFEYIVRCPYYFIFILIFLLHLLVEYVSLSRDTSEHDIKQQRDLVNGSLHYRDQGVVRAALLGRILILEGMLFNTCTYNRHIRTRKYITCINIKQQRDLVRVWCSGFLHQSDQGVVRAALLGRILILEGMHSGYQIHALLIGTYAHAHEHVRLLC